MDDFERQLDKTKEIWGQLQVCRDEEEKGRLLLSGFRAVNKLRRIYVDAYQTHPAVRKHRTE